MSSLEQRGQNGVDDGQGGHLVSNRRRYQSRLAVGAPGGVRDACGRLDDVVVGGVVGSVTVADSAGCGPGPMTRLVSPRALSTVMTSAPRSARIWVAIGPMTTDVRSRTRIPSRAAVI
jgi:hypothetical protein